MNSFSWKLTQVGWFMGSIALSASLMLLLYPPWLIIMMMAVLVIHELGHYGAAVVLQQRALLPFFIPFVFGAIGATWSPTNYPAYGRVIAMAGPALGFAVAVAMFIAFYLAALPIGMYCAGAMALREIWSATFGADGRKFRRFHTHH